MYPPQSFGGYELLWRSAMEHLRARGHEIRVLTTGVESGSDARDDPGVYREFQWYWRDHSFPKRNPVDLAGLERSNAAVLDRHMADLKPDVVSWWSMGGMSLSMLERVRRRGIPAVAFLQDDWLDWGPHVDHWMRSFGGRKVVLAPLAERITGVPAHINLEHAARYVFGSEAIRRRALRALPGLADTGIARSGIDPSYLEDPQPLLPWRWKLLYVGRIDERKGIDTAVDSLTHLPEETQLTIVGSWDEREEGKLVEQARGLGVSDRVVFAGQRERSELPAYFDAADAVLFPVRWEEPWGLVPLEAMARGRPVLATGRGGSGEYLRDGENCLLFQADDAAGLAAAIQRLAADEPLRQRLHDGGLRTAPRYTEPLYNEAVEKELVRAAGRRS
jgi:glycosyltransferase involved in cell wall biosynthesis